MLHGLGTGSDTPVRWVLLLTLACIALVTAVTGWRLAYGWPSHPVVRVAGALMIVLVLIAGGAWLAAGPLQPGWARRSGTPPSLLNTGAGGTAGTANIPPGAGALRAAARAGSAP